MAGFAPDFPAEAPVNESRVGERQGKGRQEPVQTDAQPVRGRRDVRNRETAAGVARGRQQGRVKAKSCRTEQPKDKDATRNKGGRVAPAFRENEYSGQSSRGQNREEDAPGPRREAFEQDGLDVE